MKPELSTPQNQSLQLERAQQVNQVLYAIANAVNTTLDLDELFQVIHHSLASNIDVTNFFIALVSSQEKTLYFPYFVDSVDDDFAPITNFDTGHSLTGLVVLHRKPLLLNTDELRQLADKGGIWGPIPLNWMGVPLMVRNEVIGVMAVQSYVESSLFDQQDLQLLSAISHQTAIAIDRKQSLEDLRQSEKKYRNLFHNALVGLFRTQPNHSSYKECNDAMAHMFGYANEHDFLTFFPSREAFIHPEDHQRLLEHVRSQGKVENLDVAIRKKDGATGLYRFSTVYYPEVGSIEGVVVDITEIQIAHAENLELQKKLECSKKMEALGLLAGGVAHDLNNILAGIINYPELLLMKLPANSELTKPLTAIWESGKRAAMIVADMLTIARNAVSTKELHNLHKIINEYLDSPECRQLNRIYPYIDIVTDFQASAPVILCSSVHIKKCLMNLVTNGMEAIVGPGNITITTSNTPARSGDELSTVADGEMDTLVLSVRDTGIGVSDEDVGSLFEPFYTKKKLGRSGTGLGLTIVWNTMVDHSGWVEVDNEGEGTCFKLCFPAAEVFEDTFSPQTQLAIGAGNGESVLVVDDELALRDIASRVLTAMGYSVHTVASGEMAVDYLSRNRTDLVLLDMLMEPGINGLQTYEEIIKLHPGQKAIIVSGFSESKDVHAALQLGVGSFIKKPYSLEQLSQRVKTELGRVCFPVNS